MSIWAMALAVLGLAVITAISRSFFFLSQEDWRLPPLVERGLRYAPLAAIAAVVAPDVLLTGGRLNVHWYDARHMAAVVGIGYALWRRDMLGTIAIGMVVFLSHRFGLGW